MKPVVLEFENVSKHYPLYHHFAGGIKMFLFNITKSVSSLRKERFEVFNDISFKVHEGESFGIIGRNGAGKSTTLGLIAGVLKPDSGKVTVKGRVTPFLELGSGFHPELSGLENIVLCGILMGLTREEILEKRPEIIEYSELGEFIDQPIRVYSSGMLARLGFSIVAHLDPDILLVDEILGVGDIHFQKKCEKTIHGFREKGVTFIFVSHSIHQVGELCDRVLWIDEHKTKMLGPPEEVIASYSAAM